MTRTRRLIAGLALAAALALPMSAAAAFGPQYVTFDVTYTFHGLQTAAHYCVDYRYQRDGASEVVLTEPSRTSPYGTVEVTCRV